MDLSPTIAVYLRHDVSAISSHIRLGTSSIFGYLWLSIKEEELGFHRQRLDLLDRLQLCVNQVLHRTGRCEASLHHTRMDLAAFEADDFGKGWRYCEVEPLTPPAGAWHRDISVIVCMVCVSFKAAGESENKAKQWIHRNKRLVCRKFIR